jgi:hypothetical protein
MCCSQLFIRVRKWNPRVLGGFPTDFLLAVVVAILLGIRPMTWGFKLVLLIGLMAICAELAWRVPQTRGRKAIAALLGAIAAGAIGYGPVDDQYHIDAVLRDYQSTRDLVAQYQTHDESLRYVVAQYDRLKKSNSLLGSWFGLPNQEEAINAQSVEDLKSLLNNFHAVATPFGEGLAIKLGVNMYRIIFAVPMRITPTISVGDLPAGLKMQVMESSNLGATILYTPLSQPMNIFGRPTNGN